VPPRARRYDEAELRRAWEAQVTALAEADPVAAGRVAGVLADALTAPPPPRATATALPALASLAAVLTPPPVPGPPGGVVEALAALAGAPAGRVTTGPYGDLGLGDLLLVTLTEAVARAAGPAGAEPARLDPAAVRTVARLLADALAVRAPGRSVEVRVTDGPLRVGVAVQCVAGPRHTRGTPPNVVEVSSALAWVRLAAGGLGWEAAVADGLVLPSGERADLRALLPLVDVLRVAPAEPSRPDAR
jgi:hypothetical protein